MFSFCHNFCWLLGESFINCENLTDYCYNELQLLSSAVTISIINKSKMENIKVSLPPLSEQKRIVKKIEELFTVFDTIEQSLQA